MRDYSGKIDEDVDVTEDLSISGQVNGEVTVHDGAALRLAGQTNGDVLVLNGGSARISGQLNGVLTCRGWAEISGQINGDVVVDGGVVLVPEGVQRNTHAGALVLDGSGHWIPSRETMSVVTSDSRRWQWNQDGSMTLPEAGTSTVREE